MVNVAEHRATRPLLSFHYKNRISLLITIFADNKSVLSAVFFHRQKEPIPSGFGSLKRVCGVVEKSWKVYWRAENAILERLIFAILIRDFIPREREHVADRE